MSVVLLSLVKQRLTATVEEIFVLFERTIAEYEEELSRSKQENERHRKLLDAVLQPQLQIHRADIQQLVVVKVEVPPEQQEWSSSLDQEDPEPLPHIKEEQAELWSSQEGEQLQGLEEVDITKSTFTPVPVKSEKETEDSADWKETREPGSNSQRNKQDPISDSRRSAGAKTFGCSVCKKAFTQRGHLKEHMIVHTGEKQFSCSVCDRRFTWSRSVKSHNCVGRQSSQLHQRQNEHMETEDDGEECGGPEPARISDPESYLQPETDKGGEPPLEPDDNVDIVFCKDQYEVSQLTHKTSPTKEKPFSCSCCGKWFATEGNLSGHICVHTEGKPPSCAVCEKSFLLESQLLNHECVGKPLQCHTSNPLFDSSQRGTVIDRKHQLPVTSRIQKSLRSNDGSLCGIAFSNLESSQMPGQFGEQPFCCSVCNSGVSDSEALVQHMRIHTRQTQFSCSLCGKEFAWRRSLTKHMEVHKRPKLCCRYCNRMFPSQFTLKYHECEGKSSQPLQTEAVETAADGEDCGGPEPARNSDTKTHLQPETEENPGDSSETEDSDDDDFWKQRSEGLSDLSTLKHAFSHSGETFNSNHQKEELFMEDGNQNQHMPNQEDPEPPLHIKEEQEELWSIQEGEQLQGRTQSPPHTLKRSRRNSGAFRRESSFKGW
nr:zinc finger protein 184-like [Pseudochaenichthys georgianus]